MDEKLTLLADFDSGLDKLLEVATAQKQHNLDAWIDAIKDDDQYDKFITLRLEGTCDWILSHQAYTAWISSDFDVGIAKLLWIHGPAGFGKTILCARLIQQARQILDSHLVYCFSSSHAQRVDELDGIVWTWITQLIRKDKAVLDLAHQMCLKENTRRASGNEIWALLTDILLETSCVLVLDGLDEFQGTDERKHFLCNLKKAIQASNTRILLTSRTEFDIESELRSSTGVDSPKCNVIDCGISKENVQNDIDLVAHSIVTKRLPKQTLSLRQELSTSLAARCDGQFLWLKLQQDKLRDSQSAKALWAIVQGMPQKIHSIYRRNWNGIQASDEPDRSRAINILRWLTYSCRPLRVQELAEALVVNLNSKVMAFSIDDLPDELDDMYIDNEIKNLCGSLIEVRDDTRTLNPRMRSVQIVHASAHDFLVEHLPIPPLIGSGLNILRPTAAQHANLAAHCIRFLDCENTWIPVDGNPRAFTDYAVRAWYHHLWYSEMFYNTVEDLVIQFMRPQNHGFEKWKKLHEPSFIQSSGTPFYYACESGLVSVMESLHKNENIDVNTLGGYHSTSLQATCAMGHLEAFERLLSWKASISTLGGDFQNALSVAAHFGRRYMVERLLEVTVPASVSDVEKYEAMIMATARGNMDLIQLLIQHGTSVNPLDPSHPLGQPCEEWRYFTTPLHAAAGYGYLDITHFLLKQGTNPNIQSRNGDTPLHLAAFYGSIAIVDLLLQHDAEPNTQGREGAVLHVAASKGYFDIALHLLDRQAKVDARGVGYVTPLHLAAEHDFVAMVRLFLGRGANVNSENRFSQTPLWLAILPNHIEVLKVLCDEGAVFDIHEERCLSASRCAIDFGHPEIAKFLIRRGVTLTQMETALTFFDTAADRGLTDLAVSLAEHVSYHSVGDLNTYTPLHRATHHDQYALTQLLLERGGDVNAQDNRGHTALHLAAQYASIGTMTLLLEHGGDASVQTNQGHTALSCAIQPETRSGEEQCYEKVRLLLERGAALTADNKGFTPLDAAASLGCSQTIGLLLDRGCDVDAQSRYGDTVLITSIRNNNLETARQLLSREADVNKLDENGYTALLFAVRRADLDLVQILIEKGCNMNPMAVDGTTPLHHAIFVATDQVIEYLVKCGADLDVVDHYGMSCSDWLTRLRPSFMVPRSAHREIEGRCCGPDKALLECYLLDIAKVIRRNDSKTTYDFIHLACCFLLLERDDDAMIVYQCGIFKANDGSTDAADSCCICRARQSTVEPWFACKTCAERTFCERCIQKLDHTKDPYFCGNHEILGIDTSEAKFRPSDIEIYHGWLDGIVKEFTEH